MACRLGIGGKTRPVVIVSREDFQAPRARVIYVRLTSQNRSSPYEVRIGRLPFLNEESSANVQGIGSLAIRRLERRLGVLPPASLELIQAALRYAMQL